MNTVPLPGLRFESGTASLLPGHVFGRRQPSLLVRLRARIQGAVGNRVQTDRNRLAELAAEWQSVTGGELQTPALARGPNPWPDVVVQLATMTTELLRVAQLSAVDPPQLLSAPQVARSQQWTHVLLAVAPGREQATHHAWRAVLAAAQRLWMSPPEGPLQPLLLAALKGLKRQAPQGSNTPRFLAAAYEHDIPVLPLGQEVYQYGHGRLAQWLDSTFTLNTPNIAVRLARDKQATSARLRQAGLPVPAQQAVLSADLAVQAAQRLGYPVVIKPADLDGGLGVAAGLSSDAQVRQAFDRAQDLSRRVLIEKHVPGRDYRLTVLDSQLLWAIERQPAGVTGDGAQSIQALVDRENRQPSRGDGPHAVLKRLLIDDEARALLTQQGLSPTDVPEAGRFVVLRRIANVATGGRPVAVNERVHPDNAHLAVRAAQALRLDLAGVDLLIDDIARSWRETGAAICEVNAQPQLGATTGPHLYGEILKRRLGPDARIPVIVVIGAGLHGQLARAIAAHLTLAGYTTGCVEGAGTFVGQELVLSAGAGAFAGGRLLLTHPHVDALVYRLDDDQVLRTGLPFDRYDWLVMAGQPIRSAGSRVHLSSSAEPLELLHELLSCILPACTEQVLQLPEGKCALQARWMPYPLHCEATDWQGVVERLRQRWPRYLPTARTGQNENI